MTDYDNWLEKPYANQFSVDDFPAYERYLEEWMEEQKPGYHEYLTELAFDGMPPCTFDGYLEACGLAPKDIEDFIDEMNQAAYEENLRLKGYEF